MRKFGIAVLVIVALSYLTQGDNWDNLGQIVRGVLNLLPSFSISN